MEGYQIPETRPGHVPVHIIEQQSYKQQLDDNINNSRENRPAHLPEQSLTCAFDNRIVFLPVLSAPIRAVTQPF